MQRKVKRESGDNKKVRNVKRHIYNGVTYLSGLELFAAEQLDQAGIPFVYEKKSFVLVEKFTSDINSLEERKKELVLATKKVQAISYKPDFVSLDESPYHWIMETKGLITPVFLMRWKLFKRYLTHHKLPYDLFRPRTPDQVMGCIQHIKEKLNQ